MFCKSLLYNKSKFSPIPSTKQYLFVFDEKLTNAPSLGISILPVLKRQVSDLFGRIKISQQCPNVTLNTHQLGRIRSISVTFYEERS